MTKGVKHEDMEEMKALVQSYFTNLFKSEADPLAPEGLPDVNRE